MQRISMTTDRSVIIFWRSSAVLFLQGASGIMRMNSREVRGIADVSQNGTTVPTDRESLGMEVVIRESHEMSGSFVGVREQ